MPDEIPDRLSPDDARILGLESGAVTGHTLKLVILEPGAAPLDISKLRAIVAERLPNQPRALQRVDTSGTEARWVQARNFDIDYHVRRRPAPECVSQNDLWRVVSELMAEHLDRAQPLWTFDVVGPLADGREAIAARIHHAMADGIAAVRFLREVLWDPDIEPSAKGGARPGSHSAAPVGHVAEALRMPGAVLRELGHRGSESPFDRPLSASRELAFTVASLADAKAIGASRPTGATVNDVLLAVVAGGLRDWLGSTSAPQHLRAQVPVSLHHREEAATDLGNRDSFMNIDLPLDEADPVRRLDRISAETRRRKQLDDADELYDFLHALGRVGRVGAAVQRFAMSAREFSVSISNVPGPSRPVGVAGRRVMHLFSSSEPAAHHTLRVSAISCAGDLCIGLCTDPQALPDVAALAAAIERAYGELKSATMNNAQ